MRIALFMPCFNDALFPGTGVATVRVLERLGHEVHFPSGQTCCGQIHFNTGYRREANGLMQRFLSVFGGFEAVVAPSASCVAMVREQYPELARVAERPGLGEEVAEVAGRTFELSEFLVGKLGITDVGARFPFRVTYHPTCHSTRGIRVGDAPGLLLKSVSGIELLPLPGSEECCGFGGTFSVKNPHTSLAMMEDKIRGIRESGAEVVTAVDNSCLMHLAGGLRRQGLGGERGVPPRGVDGGGRERAGGGGGMPGIRTVHLAEILDAREGTRRP